MIKRSLSILLLVTMVFTMLPTAAFAATTYNIWVGGTQVTSDNASGVTGDGISGTVTYDAGTNILTLNNAAITGYYTDGNYNAAGIYATNDIKIVLQGSNTIDISPTIRVNGVLSINGGVDLNGDGSLTINLGTSSQYSTGIGAYGFNSTTSIMGCTLTINGGTTTGNTNASSKGIGVFGSLLIEDATVIANGGSAPSANSYGILAEKTLTITNSTVIATGDTRAVYREQTVSAEGSVVTASIDKTGTGAYAVTIEDATSSSNTYKYVNITPGASSVEPVTLLVSSATANDDAARAEDATYKTFGGAITKAESGDTIKLITDITLASDQTITDKNIILDLNGHRLTGASGVAAIELTGTASLEVKDTSPGGTGVLSGSIQAIKNNGTGSVTVSSGTVTSNINTINNQSTGSVTVSGGTVSTVSDSSNAITNISSGGVTISGGTVTSNGYTISNIGNGHVTVSGGTVSGTAYTIWNNNSQGTINVSNGTVSSSGNVAIMSTGGVVNVSGGTISSSLSPMLSISSTGTLNISGGTLQVVSLPVVNISGNPTLTVRLNQLTSKKVSITGELTGADGSITLDGVSLSNTDVGTVVAIATNANHVNASKFVLTNVSGKTLEKSGADIVFAAESPSVPTDDWNGEIPDSDANYNYSGGVGTEQSPYLISNSYDLAMLASNVNELADYSGGKHFEMTADIDLNPGIVTAETNTAHKWTPIGDENNGFKGTFDGQGHTISNLYINDSTRDYAGLFGLIGDVGVISNLGVVDAFIEARDYVGVIAGQNIGKIKRSYSKAEVSGRYHIGGLVGFNSVITGVDTGIIIDSYSTVNAFGEYQVGGLVGYNQGSISNCYASGDITGNGDSISRIGGLIGYIEKGLIANSYAVGNVSGIGDGIGGLVGITFNGVITKSYSLGRVTGTTDVGGLIGAEWSKDKVTTSYWNTSTSGIQISAAGEARETTQMMTQTNYSDWNFSPAAPYDWKMINGSTYPAKAWQPLAVPNVISKTPYELLTIDITEAEDMNGDRLTGSPLITVTSDVQGGVFSGVATFVDGAVEVIPTITEIGTHRLTIDIAGAFGTQVIWVEVVPSSNADLSNLTVSGTTLDQTFTSGTTSYTASVGNTVTSIKVTPTVADRTATVKVNETAVTSGNESGEIDLTVGNNTIVVVVTAQNGATKNYTATVTRADNQYTITFDSTGGTTVESITQEYGSSVTAPVDPTKEGYSFNGWNAEVPATMPAENLTLTAQWTAIVYKITYDSNGGTYKPNGSYTIETDSITLPGAPIIKTGYTFTEWKITAREAGWFLGATYSANASISGIAGRYGDVTFTAQWKINQYTITFESAGGSEVAVITQDYDTDVTAPDEPTRTGYTFNGWSPALPAKMPARNNTHTAQWSANTDTAYKTEHYQQDAAGDSYILNETDELTGTTSATATAEAKSYTGFTENTTHAGRVESGTIAADGSLVLKRYYDRNTFTVTFDSADGSSIEPITGVRYGATITVPTAPTKTGYTFNGWYTAASGGTKIEAATTVTITADQTLYAQWDRKRRGETGSVQSKPTQNDVIVIVNGEEHNAGTETITTEDEKTTVTIEVNQKAIEAKINEAIANNPTGTGNTIQVPVINAYAQVARVELTGDIVKKLEANVFNVSIKRENIEYIIPAEEFKIGEVAEKMGVLEKDLKEIKIEVQITKLDGTVLEKYNEILKDNGAELVFPPVSFEVVAKTIRTDGLTEEVLINKFSNYVERVMEIPAGIDKSKITTGIVFNSDGTYSHVPTYVYQKDGKWYANINSLTNSTYSIIWNPIRVASVENHWSKDIVNDMASRLVIKDPETFMPDQSITRGEFAEYITKAIGIYRAGLIEDNKFTDVEVTHELAYAIELATEYGIINGYPDNTFKPDAQISRQEAMVMYARAMTIVGLEEVDNGRINNYTDKDLVASWAYNAVKKAVSVGVFNGKTDKTINPKDTFTCAEAATAIRNLLVASDLINK